MKKFLFFIIAIIFASNLSAQNLQKHIFGIREGLNFSKMDVGIGEYDNKTSFNAGFSYEYLLKTDIPLYLETGLYYSNKGCQSELDSNKTERISLNYLQIPLMLNYKFNLDKSYTIYPSIGFYYAYAVSGNEKLTTKYGNYEEIWKCDIFDEKDCDFKRSDFGYRVSVAAVWKRIVLSAGYEKSLLNVSKNIKSDDVKIKVKNSNIFISLGFNF